jgi:signal transduction histidine kinase
VITTRTGTPALLAAAGVAAGAVTAVVVAGSDILVDPGVSAAARAGFVAANVVGGAYTWWRRPSSGFGLLFAGVGLLFSLTTLNALSAPVPFTLGSVVYAVVILTLVYLFMCYPRDRLASGAERRFIAGLCIAMAVVWAFVLAVAVKLPPTGPFSDCAHACPDNPLRFVEGAAGLGRVFTALANALLIGSLLAVTALLAARMRRSAAVARRTLAPLTGAMIATSLALAAYTFTRHALGEHSPVLSVAVAVTILSLPFALLAGQLRGHLFAARRLSSIVSDIGGAREVDALVADALGDSTATVARWMDGAYCDASDRPVDFDGNQDAVELTRDGLPYALVLYDPAVTQDPDVVRGVVAAALMVDELRASRARIAEATHEGRVSIERDLHDGAQPLLSSLVIKLGMARGMATDPELQALLEEAGNDTAAAAEELRRLARGIYPPVLRERGVADALRAFALTAPVSVRVDGEAGGGSEAAQAAVYFSALEAIQNAIKHGGAGIQVGVGLEGNNGRLAFSVSDDGCGFETRDAAGGVGLTSMDDRVSALGGGLVVSSALGSGTIVRGWVPAG